MTVAALLVGLFVGFFVTNQINRRELESLRAETVRLRSSTLEQNAQNANASNNLGRANTWASTFGDLSDQEIRAAIEKADTEPDDIELQAKLGKSIYLISVETNRVEFLPDVARLLERVRKVKPDDYETLMMLGDAATVIGRTVSYQKTVDEQFARAREYYEQATRAKPDSVEARSRLGLTYFLQMPSQSARAVEEYARALQIDPQHQPTLQNLAAAQIELKQFDEASRTIEQLAQINQQNTALPALRAKLAESRNQPAAKSNQSEK